MTALQWDVIGDRVYETGTDRGVLYIPNEAGVYDAGYAWSGLTGVSENPSGAEASPQYADNIKYLNLVSIEEFGATITAFTYPDEFESCDGSVDLETGVSIGQQSRQRFGLAYRTRIGNDVDPDAGYKLHLVYGALATPSAKDYKTVNDSPEAMEFSWDITTTPVEVEGYKPTATLVVDSTKVDPTALAALESILYGGVGTDPSLPDPSTVAALFSGTITEATPLEPAYIPETEGVVIPTVTGVVYKIDGTTVTGTVTITEPTVVKASPAAGYKFPDVIVSSWYYTTTTLVVPEEPTYNSGTDEITIPTVTGVVYKIDGTTVTGTVAITEDTTVIAVPATGYAFATTTVDVWEITYS